jgi:hypothetical protein
VFNHRGSRVPSLTLLAPLLVSAGLIAACDNHSSAAPPVHEKPTAPETKPEKANVVSASKLSTVDVEALTKACSSICDVSVRKGCAKSPAACLEACGEMTRLPICMSEMAPTLLCMAGTSAEGWECGDGFPSLKEGFCAKEQENYMTCITNPN